jgi:hypothetical protein
MPDGSKLNFATPTRMMAGMNCSEFEELSPEILSQRSFSDCARDEKIFKNAGVAFNLRCKDNGNYDRSQNQNGNVFCVDDFGYAVTGLLEAKDEINCDMFIYYEQEDINIEEEFEYVEY